MRILIDADGCPVVNTTISIAKKHNLECFILCDTSHEINRDGAETLVFSKGADSVDYALVNLVQKGDIVITQDYGLAAMCLARAALPLSQNGTEYTTYNIDALLHTRYISKKMRMAGMRTKGPQKRTKKQDTAFEHALEELIIKNK